MNILKNEAEKEKHNGRLASYVFDIKECLNSFDNVMKDFPITTIKYIPKDFEMENSPLFHVLLKKFNEIYGKELSTTNILTSRSSFNAFYDFLVLCDGYKIKFASLQIKKDFMKWIYQLRQKYNQNLRSAEKYYDEIMRKIYYPQKLTKADEQVKKEMYRFEQAYSLMKLAFENEKRDSGERYFEHLKWVMEILLRELPKPNLNKIIIALLHDVKEDLPEYADVVNRVYGNYISDWVDALSKKDRMFYLNGIERKELEKSLDDNRKKEIEWLAKDRRNDDYFWHLDNLNDDYLDVKLADRIHNLRDMNGVTREKAIRKVKETEKYFLDIAKNRNPKAYDLIMKEIERLKKKFEFNGEK